MSRKLTQSAPKTEQFAALYGSLDKDDRYPVMGWSKDFTSVGDPETVLVELLCFVEEEIPIIQVPGRTAPALARALLGPHLAENVTLMRRDVDTTSTPSNIVIATPRQIRDLLQTPLTQTAWTRAIANVDMVVVDEADRLVNKWNLHQRRVRQRQDKEDPAVMVLRMIEEETTKENRREEWQLVAASATMSRRTNRNLKFSAGIDLTLIRSPGSLHWQAPDKPKIGQYGDGSTSWPAGLRHRVRVPNPFRFPKVMSVAAQTIVELQARRVLVVLATTGERGKAPKSVYGLNLVLGQLNFRLQEYGPGQYEVLTCREAIDEAAKLWSPEGSAQRTQRRPGCQVVVANCEAIRGIHLDNVDAVVLLGDPSSVADYLHCVGRTCRYQPGAAEPVEGTAVSIVNDQAATRLLHWGTLSGFKLVEVPLRTHLTTGGPAARPPSKEREEEDDLEELSEEDFFLRELELKDLERSKGRRARDFQDLEDDLLEESEASAGVAVARSGTSGDAGFLGDFVSPMPLYISGWSPQPQVQLTARPRSTGHGSSSRRQRHRFWGVACAAALSMPVTFQAQRRRADRSTAQVAGISAVVKAGYDGLLLDQYGVLHDGKRLLPDTLDCLAELRQRKVALAIVSNSPCEAQKAQSRVEDLGLRPEDFVSFVTSGDLAKRHLQLLISEAAPARLRCLFISHEDHLQRGTWSPEELRIMGLELVASAQDADFILANGVQVCNKGTLSEQRSTFESDASWEVFGSVLQQAAELQRPLIIANPDCVVHRADGTAFNCPGCFAKKYTAFGGSRLFVFGKPGRDIFREAAAALKTAGAKHICHVGDSLVHDVGGAAAAGFDSVLVKGGIHAAELQQHSISELCVRKAVPMPNFSVPRFRW
ncbi:unnamed protein product [Effrenium voratum]|nr:unnamed protein product [Effrenium voratum]